MSNRDMFGAAKHGGGGYKSFRLQPGSNLYRLGPPFKSLAASGKWFAYTKQHFGYRGAGDEQNPKGRIRTFVCPEEIDRQTEMVKVECKECNKIREMVALLESRIAGLKSEGKNEAQIETLVGPVKAWLKEHNLDKKYITLAKNENSEWGVLSLPYKAKSGLDMVIKKCRAEEGFDPLDMDKGCWINFTREGEGFKTVYLAEAATETVIVDGKRAKSIKMDGLTDADFDQIAANCPDLTTVGRRLTQEQIAQLVECNGDPEEVDRIFNSGAKVEKSPSAVTPVKTANQVVKVKQEENVATFVRVEVPAETVQPVAADATVDDEEAQLLAALAAARAKKSKPAVKVAAPTGPTTEEDLKGMSEDDFFALYPGKKAR
jgi:hypothetical protein